VLAAPEAMESANLNQIDIPIFLRALVQLGYALQHLNVSDQLCCTIDATEYHLYASEISHPPFVSLTDHLNNDSLILKVGYNSIDLSEKWEMVDYLDNSIIFSYSS
jgi:hypothetical protein